MNNLYDRIYSAINEELHKFLMVDDNGSNMQDINITYKRRNIKNNIETEKKFKKAVSEFMIKKADYDLYDNLITLSYNTYQYVPKKWKDLNKAIRKSLKFQNKDINWIDTSNFVKFIMKDDSEFNLDDVNIHNMHNIRFIKFINNICRHDIIIHKDLLISSSKWINDLIYNFNDKDCVTDISEAINDYNGYNHTYNNINIKNFSNYPALEYCVSKSNNKYAGYLPAAGEMQFLFDNKIFVNYIIQNVLKSSEKFDINIYHTSTEYSYELFWYIYPHGVNYNLAITKQNQENVLPFFKKII